MDHFCICISRRLLSGKAPSHEVNTFTHIKGLIYKHVMDSNQRPLALVTPKFWHFTVLVEVHDKLGHLGVNRTYHLVKCQYYWKGMSKDPHKYYLHIGNQATGKIRLCNMKDVVHEPPVELWNVNTLFGRAWRFINHPTNLPPIPLNTTML